jgi:hypothetical protein
MRTTVIGPSHCIITNDVCLHGTVSVAITGLTLTNANVHTLQLIQITKSTVLAAAASVTVAGGNASASLVLESAELIAAFGASKELGAQLYLWDATANICAWNDGIKIRWAPYPTGYVVTTPGVTAITAAQATALFALSEMSGPATSTAGHFASYADGAGKILADSGYGGTDFAGTAVASTTAAGLAPQATAPAAGLLSVLGIANGETVRTDKAIITAAALTVLDDPTTADMLATLGAEPAQTAASQAEMETGTEAALRSVSPLRVAQAIAHDAVPKATYTQDGGIVVGTGAGTYQEETGATLRTSLGVGAIGTLAAKTAQICLSLDGGGAPIVTAIQAALPRLAATSPQPAGRSTAAAPRGMRQRWQRLSPSPSTWTISAPPRCQPPTLAAPRQRSRRLSGRLPRATSPIPSGMPGRQCGSS